MPNKPYKYCAAFPCSLYALPGSAYCIQHQHTADSTRRDKKADSFYVSTQWRRFRDYYINKHPLCEHCLEEGRETPADLVDHIIEIKDGGSLTSEDNAQALCHKCHNLKTAAERSKRENHQESRIDNRRVNRTRS